MATVSLSVASGCYSCLSHARFVATCTSRHSLTTHVECGDDLSFSLLCDVIPIRTVIRFQYAYARVNLSCTYLSGKQPVSTLVTGTLVYASSWTSSSGSQDTFLVDIGFFSFSLPHVNFPDVYFLLSVFSEYRILFSLLILLVVIVCLSLLISPTLLIRVVRKLISLTVRVFVRTLRILLLGLSSGMRFANRIRNL